MRLFTLPICTKGCERLVFLGKGPRGFRVLVCLSAGWADVDKKLKFVSKPDTYNPEVRLPPPQEQARVSPGLEGTLGGTSLRTAKGPAKMAFMFVCFF